MHDVGTVSCMDPGRRRMCIHHAIPKMLQMLTDDGVDFEGLAFFDDRSNIYVKLYSPELIV